MIALDWLVLLGTIVAIVAYGTWKTRSTNSVESFLKGSNQKWWMIGVSIMATQASAVTFLSTPGQAVEDGMRFLQFYLGLPLAMVIISVTMLPIYYRLKVFTAYEYLETRFDFKVRTLAAILFLLLRGLSVGITLFAPSLVLSTILGWDIFFTTLLIGIAVIIYSVTGGSAAVSLTQQLQMSVILGGMIVAGVIAFTLLPSDVSFANTVNIAGELGKLNIISTKFHWNDRYNIWSGLFASTFLFLSYFGTDQSQVARYLGGKSLTESRMGLIFNGLLKIPMQFVILFIGVLVFVFYQFNQPPIFHNEVLLKEIINQNNQEQFEGVQKKLTAIFEQKSKSVTELVQAIKANDQEQINTAKEKYHISKLREDSLKLRTRKFIASSRNVELKSVKDTDYVFLNFVLHYLPHGFIGLLLAVMFSAAMSSMAGELNALASTTTVDIYKRIFKETGSALHYLNVSRGFIILWALIAIVFAWLANFSENLIQYVNIIGSLFYGTMLGIFLVAFYFKSIKSNAVFWAAVIAELSVLTCYRFFYDDIAFLYYNIIGCAVVLILSILFQLMSVQKKKATD
ncbi:MAG TPA: sodium:solute symporter [Cytophagales bacterium]|jgi:solute:Na+ symporter, SSS family|nr:sodium:solute symporter [Cytophagales bacterium]